MDPIALALVVIIGVGAIIFALYYFSAAQRVKRRLRAAPRFRIGELPENTAGRVVGTARALGATLRSPFTGRACVYYQAVVEEQRSNGKTTYWSAIISESRGVPFEVADDSGRALVDPNAAQVALDFDGNSHSGTFDDATPIEEAFLARHGNKSKGWFFNKGLRYREAIIELGERIAILGSGVREPDPDASPSEGYRGAPPTRLRLTSSPNYPLLISDDHSTTT